MKPKFDIVRNVETAQFKTQVIRDLIWRARSVNRELDLPYVESLAAQIDEILFKVIINLNKKEKDNA
jgi:hypothetical protein